jgi:subtilisin family serine protease
VNHGAPGRRRRGTATVSLGAATVVLALLLPLPAVAEVSTGPAGGGLEPAEGGLERAGGSIAAAAATGAVATEDDHVRLLVAWTPDATPTERARVLAASHLDGSDVVSARVDVVAVPIVDADRIAATLRANDAVATVEANQWVYLAQSGPPPADPPADPLFRDQWALHNTGVPVDGVSTTAGVDVRALDAWAYTQGDADVVVAVIDSGVNPDHPDLEGALWVNPGEVGPGAQDGVDSDGNGYVDDVHGWNFVGDTESNDIYVSAAEDWHGTAVSSVIAAQSNDVGMVGLAPGVRIMVLKAFSGEAEVGRGDLVDILEAFEYARVNGADVINASWFNTADTDLLRAAVADAGVPVVAAAGNDDWDLSGGVRRVYPANYTLPNLVAVTAVDPDGQRPRFANYGRTDIEVAAPGDVIRVATPNGWALQSGTSFATPFVSAAIALALSRYPDASAAEVVDAVSWTSRVVPGSSNTTISRGMLDVGTLLRELDRPICGHGPIDAELFADVDPANPHAHALRCLRATGVAAGDGAGNFRPGATITRAQLATLLAQALQTAGIALPSDPPDAFNDDDGSVHEPAINQLAALGILAGDVSGGVRPWTPVTRGQLAALLVRAHDVVLESPSEPSRNWFRDDDRTTHAAAIDAARDLGLIRGVGTLRYAPEETSRRDQVASLVARLLDALARHGGDHGAADGGTSATDTGTP